MNEGSWVGLDVHARSVVAGVIDAGSGEVRSLRVPPGPDATVAWLKTLPAPVRVAYEAGPTGYGLARACSSAGISCAVAVPSRIRPAADRVKTDRRDAERLARLLRLGEITPVRVPGPEEEAARDLVRAREDTRGDLMRARHRLSKLLLRHGMVYDGTAWTKAHDAWLRRQRFQNGPLAIVFDECLGGGSGPLRQDELPGYSEAVHDREGLCACFGGEARAGIDVEAEVAAVRVEEVDRYRGVRVPAAALKPDESIPRDGEVRRAAQISDRKVHVILDHHDQHLPLSRRE